MRYTTFGRRTGLRVSQYTRLTDVSAVPLGIPQEANADSLNRLQGGAASLIDGPAVPVA